MESGLDGRVAVVTGGSSGIGRATAELLLDEGARVAFCARDAGRLGAAEADLARRFGAGRVFAAACDVLDGGAVEAFRERVEERFGGADVLVNNAGRAGRGAFGNTSDAAWRDELDLKFFSVIRPTRAFLPLLEASDRAAVVCVNALLAQHPAPHMVATSAARAGLLNLTKSMSVEFAPKGIRVNSVLIGLVDSGQWTRRYEAEAPAGVSRDDWYADLARDRRIPLGRLGRPEEAAAAIVFLASGLASYTTGAALDVSGGQAGHV